MFGFRPHFLIFLLPVLAGAQEPSGLEKAKQDLRSLPAVRKESERTDLRLPTVTAPAPSADLPVSRPPVPRPGTTTAEAAKAKAADNWLVDAMMKNQGRPGASGHQDAVEKEPLLAAHERESALAAGNPLAPFMADWISKRDHALLLPKEGPGQGFGADATGADIGRDPPFTITFRGIDEHSGQASGSASPQPAENPFLQALPIPAVPASTATRSPVMPTAGDRAPSLAPPLSAPGSRPQPPIDLSKPPDDKKYFPQLKRF